MEIAPSLFINHGGGPYPVMGQHENLEIAESLKSVKNYVDLKQLKAIIVVTAHWEEDIVSISSAAHHDLLYDYNNFPPETYKYKYNAPGDPELAKEIHKALTAEGIRSKLDDKRGWDHGIFIPMMLINPDADIPIVQVSILKNQKAEDHYKLGEVLLQFRKRGVAIFGSGMTYHNEAGFKKARPSDGVIVNTEFDSFIDEACKSEGARRKELFLKWDQQPGALESHPVNEADHLMPLIVNAGAGGADAAEKTFSGIYLGKFKIGGYLWRSV